MVRKEFFLYDNDNGEKEIIIPGDVALIKIEVFSGVNITAQGKLTKDNEIYSGLMGIKSNDLKPYVVMSEGLFTIEVNGIYSVKFNSDTKGTVKVRMIG